MDAARGVLSVVVGLVLLFISFNRRVCSHTATSSQPGTVTLLPLPLKYTPYTQTPHLQSRSFTAPVSQAATLMSAGHVFTVTLTSVCAVLCVVCRAAASQATAGPPVKEAPWRSPATALLRSATAPSAAMLLSGALPSLWAPPKSLSSTPTSPQTPPAVQASQCLVHMWSLSHILHAPRLQKRLHMTHDQKEGCVQLSDLQYCIHCYTGTS